MQTDQIARIIAAVIAVMILLAMPAITACMLSSRISQRETYKPERDA